MKFGQSLAVSLAALLCTASLALAQAPDKGAGGMGGGQAPAEKMEKGQGGGAARGQENRQPSRGMSQPGGEQRGARSGPDRGTSERAQGGERSGGDRTGRPEGGRQQPKAAQRDRDRDQDKAQRTEQDRGQNRAQDKAARKGQDNEKAARSARERDQQRAQGTDRERTQDRTQRTDRDRDQGKAAERRSGPDRTGQAQPANRVQASEKQHADVRQHLLRDRGVERTRVNVSRNIGTAVPRSVRLRPLSAAVIGFAPVYRGYSYIVLEDETICIVDPRTYVIVDVIPASSQRAEGPGQRGHLSLSADERRLVLSSIDRRPSADISVRLALGAEVPSSVEVAAFPERVIERIPRLRSYGYVVAQDQVVIVDPSDHQVALLISD